MMIRKAGLAFIFLSLLNSLSGCSFNPFLPYTDNTGTATGTAVGAGAGAGTAALLGASRWWIAGAGVAGGALGYYATTLRFQSGGIFQYGGDTYQIGQTIGIYIPTDSLFEPNTADFRPEAPLILDSAATVLNREPGNNILISGNTSGFGQTKWELWLSEKRAEKVSAYFWKMGGVNPFRMDNNNTRKLIYVGYGDYFPIAGDLKNKSIRQNSRIQIVSYPTSCDLKINARHYVYNNIGQEDDEQILQAPQTSCRWDKFGNPIDCD